MFKIILKIIKKPSLGILIFFIYILGFPYILLSNFPLTQSFLINFISFFFIILIISEIIFRISYQIYYKVEFRFIKKIPFDKLYVEPHPYLPYIYKKNFDSAPPEKFNYPLHTNYYSAKLKTNNFGFYNGIDGNRDIKIPKPKEVYRISCLGGSTTANYVSDGKNNYSYPLELENILKQKNSNIEVNNCGTGGYNSADILVRFLLQTIEMKPNLVIIYHAYNDIRSYLTQDFKEDYSHSRKNLGEQYWRFRLRGKIPDLPLKFYNYLINHWFPSNIRYSLLETISKGKFDLDLNYKKGLEIYERNIKNLIYICQKNKIDIILSSYCFYLHEKATDSKINQIYQKIVLEENEVIRKLAQQNNLKFVDCNAMIPKEIDYFLDTVHLTPKGMQFVANQISDAVETNLSGNL